MDTELLGQLGPLWGGIAGVLTVLGGLFGWNKVASRRNGSSGAYEAIRGNSNRQLAEAVESLRDELATRSREQAAASAALMVSIATLSGKIDGMKGSP